MHILLCVRVCLFVCFAPKPGVMNKQHSEKTQLQTHLFTVPLDSLSSIQEARKTTSDRHVYTCTCKLPDSPSTGVLNRLFSAPGLALDTHVGFIYGFDRT